MGFLKKSSDPKMSDLFSSSKNASGEQIRLVQYKIKTRKYFYLVKTHTGRESLFGFDCPIEILMRIYSDKHTKALKKIISSIYKKRPKLLFKLNTFFWGFLLNCVQQNEIKMEAIRRVLDQYETNGS